MNSGGVCMPSGVGSFLKQIILKDIPTRAISRTFLHGSKFV